MQDPPQSQTNQPQYPAHPVQPPTYPPQYPTQPVQPTYPPQYPAQPPTYPPQYPQYAPQYPPPLGYQAPQSQSVYFQNQSFTTKAVIAFLLYWLGYVPGLTFNIMFLMEAHRVQRETQRTPSGLGCLWATLVGGLIPLIGFGFVVFLIIIGMIAAAGAPSY